MLSSPFRGERPPFSAGLREESVRHSLQAAERRASGIPHRSPRAERPAFAAARREESVRHSPQTVQRTA